MIQKHLLSRKIIWMIFINISKNIIQIKKRKALILFDDMIANMLSNKNLNPIVTELFIRGRNLILFYCFKKY